MAMTWKDARTAAGKTQEAVWLAWNARPMPAEIKKDLSRTKLQRLEKGLSAKLSPITKAHLADLLEQPLSMIDEAAAIAYRELMQDPLISTWMMSETPAASIVAA